MTETLQLPIDVPPTRGRRRWLGVVVAGLAIVLGLGFHWMLDDHALYPYGGLATSSRIEPHHTVYAGIGTLPTGVGATGSRRLNVRSAHLRVAENTSGATIEVLICHAAPPPAVSVVSGGMSQEELLCGSSRPFAAGSLQFGPLAGGLVVAVTPHRAGTVHIEGIDLTYLDGIRRSHQHVGSELTFTTTG